MMSRNTPRNRMIGERRRFETPVDLAGFPVLPFDRLVMGQYIEWSINSFGWIPQCEMEEIGE